MNNGVPSSNGWRQRLGSALVLLLVVAIGARVAWTLLAPLVPTLVVGAVLLAILWIALGRRR